MSTQKDDEKEAENKNFSLNHLRFKTLTEILSNISYSNHTRLEPMQPKRRQNYIFTKSKINNQYIGQKNIPCAL